MTVFKTYLKMIKSFKSVIILYLSIFMGVALLVGSIGPSNTGYKATKPNVYINNNDNSIIVTNFINYVKDNANIIKLDDTKDSIKDALFARMVDYVIDIPSNYGNDFISGKAVKMKTTSIPNASATTYSSMLFNKYLKIYKVYLDAGIDESKIQELVINDLKSNVKVNILDTSKKDIEKVNYFYNYTNYTILATSILIIGMITNIFTSINIKRRNQVSPVSYQKINRQLFIGHSVLSIGIWLLYILISFIMYRETMLSINGLFYMLNSFIFSIMALSLGFLIGNLITNREAQNGVVNLIALGTSFLCGAFVPQELLGSSLLKMVQVLPSYWYIKTNNDIALLSSYNWSNILPIIVHMSIIVVFTMIFFLLTNIVTKKTNK